MNTKTIRFTANEQCLELVGEPLRLADDTVNYIEAVFELGENWSGFDSVSAVWYNSFKTIATVLDAQGTCFVPAEVLSRPSKVSVNLVGTIVNGDEVEARLTTAPVLAVYNEVNARVSGAETQPVTPSQFDQFVAQVAALVASVKDIDSVVLNDDYTLTINFSDGTSTTVGPIRGAQGPQGATGNGIQSVYLSGQSGTNPRIDEYTILFTDGSTTTFTVTNGVKGDTGAAAGFGTVTATADINVGTPSVTVTSSGEDTAKNFAFAFHNLGYDDSDLQADFADLADDFDVLQGQFDTAVAALTVDSEVADIRVGDDGVTYNSAGNAVRTQFSNVKDELNEKFPVDPSMTFFFNNRNYGIPANVTFTHIWADLTGKVNTAGATTNSLIIHNVKPNTRYYWKIPSANRTVVVESSSSFVVGQTYNVLTNTVAYNVTEEVNYFTTGASAKSVMIYFYGGSSYDYSANADNIVVTADNYDSLQSSLIDEAYIPIIKAGTVQPFHASFFDNENYANDATMVFSHNYPYSTGQIYIASDANSLIIDVEPSTTYYIYVPSANRQILVESSSGFVLGNTYTLVTLTHHITYNGVSVFKFTTGATAKKIMFYFYSGSYDYVANKANIIMTKDTWNPSPKSVIKEQYLPEAERMVVEPIDTTFFNGCNYFDSNEADYYTDRFIQTDGKIYSGSNTNTIVFPAEPNTTYYFYVPDSNRGIIAEKSDNDASIGAQWTTLYTSGMQASGIYTFTTGSTAKYVGMYFCSGSYDYAVKKSSFVLNKGKYYGNITPFVNPDYLPSDIGGVLNHTKVLIFGDSITDTCRITINGNDETTAYIWNDPSNSYIDGGGNTVTYSMWPKILRDAESCDEIRNYARAGASYKTSVREAGEERQNLHYQIDVAMNDLDNPNNVFTVDNFVPDIVIFALGTNDGTPNDTYDSAMAATVFKDDNVTIDVDATITAMDETKFCQSARKAFMRIKRAFPMAQIFCVLPIQRVSDDRAIGTLHDYLKQMAQRYGCIIIDGAFDSGITRDGNNNNAIGTYLKDGLHPNEKGQNLMARAIISSLKSHYMPFSTGFNS